VLFIRGVGVECKAVIAVMIVFTNLSRIAMRSSCLICRAKDKIVGTKVEVKGCNGECEVECKVEDEDFEGKVVEAKIIEGVEPAKTNFAAL
jgi:hypothetical protein